MKVLLEFEINKCGECPFIKTGWTFGNDGRDGRTVYICSKGAFGILKDKLGYSEGLIKIPDDIPKKCPIKPE